VCLSKYGRDKYEEFGNKNKVELYKFSVVCMLYESCKLSLSWNNEMNCEYENCKLINDD
jgi:hypothetical protein